MSMAAMQLSHMWLSQLELQYVPVLLVVCVHLFTNFVAISQEQCLSDHINIFLL